MPPAKCNYMRVGEGARAGAGAAAGVRQRCGSCTASATGAAGAAEAAPLWSFTRLVSAS